MEITQYNNVGMQDLQNRIDQLNQANSTSHVDATRGESNNVVFTITTGGKTYTVPDAVSLPEIDLPADTSSTEELDKVIKSLEEAIAKLEAAAGKNVTATNSSGSASASAAVASVTNVFFDLYAAIALLKETAQKQRQQAMEIRQNQHETLAQSMLDEASMIVKNADSAYNNSMALQIVNTCVSVGALCATVGSSLAQRSVVAKSDAAKTSASIDNLKSTAKEIANAPKEQIAQVNAEAKAQQANQNQMIDNLQEVELADIINDDADEPQVNNANNVNQQQAPAFDAAEKMPKSTEAKTKSMAMKRMVGEAQGELDTAKQELQQAMQGDDTAKITAAEEKVAAKSEALSAAKGKYANALVEENLAMKEEIAGMENPEDAKAAKDYRLNRLVDVHDDMAAVVKEASAELKGKYDFQVQSAMESRTFKRAQNVINMTSQGMQAVQAGVQMIQSTIQRSSEYGRASEKRKQNEQESIRADLEVTNEDVRRAYDLLQDCNNLIKAINDSERQVTLAIAQRI